MWPETSGWERFEQLLEDFPEGVAVFSDEQRIVAANAAYCEIVDWPLDELVGKSIHELVAIPREQSERRLQNLVSQGRTRSRVAIRTGGGEIRIVEYTARADAAPGRHVAFVRDITDEHERETELVVRAGILDSLEAGVYVIGTEGTITIWNRAAERITGYSAAEAIGARIEDICSTPAAELDALGRRVEAAMNAEQGQSPAPPIEVRGLRRRKDGTLYSSYAEVSHLRNDQGGHVGVLVMIYDLGRERDPSGVPVDETVSGLMVAVGREAIAGSPPGELLEFAIEQLASSLRADLVGSWRIDARSGEVALERGLGWPQDCANTALESPDAELILPESATAFEVAEEVLERGGLLERAGVRSGVVVPIPGHGRSDGSLGVFTREPRRFSPPEIEAVTAVADLVAAVRARVRLARIEGDLDIARRQASLGALISGVAHDFNNMLSVMLGYARLMAPEAEGSELLTEGVTEIEAAARRAMRLSRGLVDLGRPAQTEPEQLSVSGIVHEVAELLHRTVGDTIDLRVDDRAAGATVSMPPGELDRVIVNLVANSRDALPDGGSVLIRARAEPEAAFAQPERVVIEVVDDGAGIPKDVLDRVLEASFTTKARGEGSGIGLSAADAIVRAAGGTLELESELGHGTTARVVLPVAVP